MNKTELIAAVAEEAEMTKKDAEKAVKAVIDVISDALVQGDKVQLIGFGTFEVRERGARVGHNPFHSEGNQDSCIQSSGFPRIQTAERKSKRSKSKESKEIRMN